MCCRRRTSRGLRRARRRRREVALATGPRLVAAAAVPLVPAVPKLSVDAYDVLSATVPSCLALADRRVPLERSSGTRF